MDPSDNYQTTHDSKTKTVVFLVIVNRNFERVNENEGLKMTALEMSLNLFNFDLFYQSACEMTLNAIWLLPESASEGAILRPPSPERQLHSSKHLRQLQLLPCTTSMVMPFFVQLLLLSYKVKLRNETS